MMKFKITPPALVAAGLALLCQPMEAQTPQLEAALQSLYDQADRQNATLQSLRTAVNEAQAAEGTTRMARLPEVSAQLSLSYLGDARLWNRQFGQGTTAPMPHFGNNFVLRAEQAVYTGGALTASTQLARQNSRMANLTAEEARQRVHFLLTAYYLQLHNLRNGQAVYAANVRLARQMVELMQKRRAQGVSLQNDITRYELQLRQMELGETALRDRQRIVLRQLATALGSDSATCSLLGETAFDNLTVPDESEAVWQERALQQHLSLQKASLEVDMGRTREKTVRSEMLPHVALLAEDHLDGPITVEVPPLDRNLNYWFVGVGVSYNLSSLYKSRQKLRQSRLATTLAADRHTVALQQVGDAVHAAYVNLGTARTELDTRETSVRLATENYDVVSQRYAGGLALVTDLTDAASMKLDAELALADARINLLYCYYQLRFAACLFQ